MSDKIVMYTKQNCPQCVVAKGKLKIAGVEYTEIFIDSDLTARQTLMEAGHRSVPVFYIENVSVKLEDLLSELKHKGE